MAWGEDVEIASRGQGEGAEGSAQGRRRATLPRAPWGGRACAPGVSAVGGDSGGSCVPGEPHFQPELCESG